MPRGELAGATTNEVSQRGLSRDDPSEAARRDIGPGERADAAGKDIGPGEMVKLQIEIEQQGEAVVIRLAGSADMAEVTLLNRELDGLFRQGQYRLVIEVSGLEFASSMALGALIRSHHQCRAAQGRMVLVSPAPRLQGVLATTRLTQLFEIAENVDDALVQCNQSVAD